MGGPMTSLVVGVDFSDASRKALDAAVQLAKGLQATVVLVHAGAPLPAGSKAGRLDPISQVRVEVDADEARRLAATWGKKAGAEVVSRSGKAEDVILDVARERKATYVVVGSHGRTGIRRAVMGSVAEAVVRASPIPVLVVPS